MKFITFLFLLFSFQNLKCDVILPLIDDLITHNSKTQIIISFLCQKKDGLVLTQHFSPNYQVSIIHPNVSEISYPYPPSYVTFVLDAQCLDAKNLLLIANKEKLFADPFNWVIYYNEIITVEELNRSFFENLDILVDSDLTLAAKTLDNTFKIVKIFKRHLNSPLLIEEIGCWSLNNGLIETNYEKITYKRRRNLMQTVLSTCLVITNNDSLHHLTDKRDIHIDSIAKVNYVLVEHLADTINASLKYFIQSTWGYKDKDGQWSGMIGKLTRNEVDIGGTALFMTSDRVKIIDYIAMTTKTRSKFIFRQPKLSYVANVYTLPFDGYVWASSLGLLFIVAAILYIATHWEWRKKDQYEIMNESNEPEILNSWIEVLFESFAALCQQGTYSVPYSIPGRITLIFLLVSYMFLYTSYSANIVALMQSSSSSIQTLQDILNSRLDVGVDNTVFNHFYFPNATEPVRRALYLQKVAPPGQKPKFYPIEEGIKRMRKGLFAFHVETGPGYKFVSETFREDEKCGLKEIQFLQVSDPWLAIQKNSSYKKMLKVGLRLLQENGIQDREVGLIYTKKPQCLSRGSSYISVGIIDCYFTAVILGGGLGASLVILILEIFVDRRIKLYTRNRHSKRRQF